MKKILTLIIALLSLTSFAQTENSVDLPIQREKYTAHNKGKFFFFIGEEIEPTTLLQIYDLQVLIMILH